MLSFNDMELMNGRVFTTLDKFFSNHKLTSIELSRCNFGYEDCRQLALAIGSSTSKSLQHVTLQHNGITDEGMVYIITALSMHPQLQTLELEGNHLRTNGCIALSTLLQNSTAHLQSLDLSSAEINDEGIDSLIPALKNNPLQSLRLENNSITSKGLQKLTSLLEPPNSNLTGFFIMGNNIDDEVVTAFTSALVNNRTLTTLGIRDYPTTSNLSITDEGWKAFSELLCDTSSVNSTFRSNHTLQNFG